MPILTIRIPIIPYLVKRSFVNKYAKISVNIGAEYTNADMIELSCVFNIV